MWNFVIVAVKVANVPYIPDANRAHVASMGDPGLGIFFVSLRFGFKEYQNIPKPLSALNTAKPPLISEYERRTFAPYRFTLVPGTPQNIWRWQKRLFIGLAHNAANPAARFCLPPSKTIVMGSFLEL